MLNLLKRPEVPHQMHALPRLIKQIESTDPLDLPDLQAQLEDQRATVDSLLPIEADAVLLAKTKLEKIEEKVKFAKKLEILGGQYMPIDFAPLTWRDPKTGLPQLVPFSLSSPDFSIKVKTVIKPKWIGVGEASGRHTTSTEVEFWPQIPAKMLKHYKDTIEKLTAMAERKPRIMLATTQLTRTLICGARFSGTIPDFAREAIKAAQPHFQSIFLLAEPKLTITSEENTKTLIPPDPVVVGWDGEFMWHICHFDITPLEEAALLIGPNNKN
jgi:hypothetical protein